MLLEDVFLFFSARCLPSKLRLSLLALLVQKYLLLEGVLLSLLNLLLTLLAVLVQKYLLLEGVLLVGFLFCT